MYTYAGCSINSFMWKRPSSPEKKKSFAKLSPTPRLSLAVHVGQDFKEELGCVISANLLQASDPLSNFILRQLHLNIYVLLKDGGPCSPSSASSATTSPQFRPPSFRGKAIFRQALAKLSRKITQYTKWNIHSKQYLQCKIRHVCMNFCQNFSQEKKL